MSAEILLSSPSKLIFEIVKPVVEYLALLPSTKITPLNFLSLPIIVTFTFSFCSAVTLPTMSLPKKIVTSVVASAIAFVSSSADVTVKNAGASFPAKSSSITTLLNTPPITLITPAPSGAFALGF